MSDTQELTAEDIAAGKHGVPTFAETIHKLIDRVLPQHTWEGQQAHESVRREFDEPEPEVPALTVVPTPSAPGAAFDYDALAAAMVRQQAAQAAAAAPPEPAADQGNPGGGDPVNG
jgi:hypothetical protein